MNIDVANQGCGHERVPSVFGTPAYEAQFTLALVLLRDFCTAMVRGNGWSGIICFDRYIKEYQVFSSLATFFVAGTVVAIRQTGLGSLESAEAAGFDNDFSTRSIA